MANSSERRRRAIPLRGVTQPMCNKNEYSRDKSDGRGAPVAAPTKIGSADAIVLFYVATHACGSVSRVVFIIVWSSRFTFCLHVYMVRDTMRSLRRSSAAERAVNGRVSVRAERMCSLCALPLDSICVMHSDILSSV